MHFPLWFIVEYDDYYKTYGVKLSFREPKNSVVLLINNNNPSKPHVRFDTLELFK